MIVTVNSLTKEFFYEKSFLGGAYTPVKAVAGVSFSVPEHSSMGIVGESGCGKTTLAKMLLGLIKPTSGEIIFDPLIITHFRKDVQMIFQNPYGSLNPKMRVFDIVSEPFVVHKLLPRRQFEEKVRELLISVELDESALTRFPSAFSGGQRQRIAIARALACSPKFLILDEPVSSLDLTIQSRMLDLLIRLKKSFSLTYIFISHNLALIKYLTDSVLVMKEGAVVEQAATKDIFNAPRQSYTRSLLEASKEKL